MVEKKVKSYEALVMQLGDRVASIAFVHRKEEVDILNDVRKYLEEDDI